MKGAAVFGIIAFGVSLSALIPKFGQLPAWFQKAPCMFQSTLSAFALLVSTADLVLDVIKILPMLGVAVLAFWHLRGKNRKSPNSEWKPLNQNVLWFLFVAKLFGPLVLFTAVNFKLPQYAPYDEIAVKSETGSGKIPQMELEWASEEKHLQDAMAVLGRCRVSSGNFGHAI